MIYTNLNNSGEVEAVYAAKRATTTGTPPLSCPSKGYDLEDFLISGNTIQNGTPTPSDPVDVVGCGVRTGNLFDKDATDTNNGYVVNKFLTSSGDTSSSTLYNISEYIELSPSTVYTVFIGSPPKNPSICFYDANKNYIEGIAYNSMDTITVTTPANAKYCRVSYIKELGGVFMLNTGSTPLPYEPYGYKLPLTINGTEYPIYLGQVETTRKIKKLVLTGEESNWGSYTVQDGSYCAFLPLQNFMGSASTAARAMLICTHYIIMAQDAIYNGSYKTCCGGRTNQGLLFRDENITTATDWKSYLAAQYAAGTPVTVWYVLATPETGIVNEPLHKISTYADTISLSQSGITVPTTKGVNIITTETTVLPSSISVTTPEKEVAEVYAGINYQNPIYYKTRTLTGVSPLTYKALGQPLSDYLISGNTVQNGTPTHEAPVDVVGCGVRTGNLFDYVAYFSSTFTEYSMYFDFADIQLTPNTTYTFSTNFIEGVTSGNTKETPFIVMNSTELPRTSVGGLGNKTTRTLTTDSSGVIRVYKRTVSNSQAEIPTLQDFQNGKWVMCNIGSEPLPYEPYGYKLPLTINGTECPIYLGQVETTRKIKKLVLTGKESEYTVIDSNAHIFTIRGVFNTAPQILQVGGYCTHYKYNNAISSLSANMRNGDFVLNRISNSNYSFTIKDDTLSSSGGFKSYIAAQYAAGTPVTVWYVLANPETAVVNEPLHKIGDYADTISFAQAGVTIPTVAGMNTLTVDTTVQPSEVSITGNIKEVSA